MAPICLGMSGVASPTCGRGQTPRILCMARKRARSRVSAPFKRAEKEVSIDVGSYAALFVSPCSGEMSTYQPLRPLVSWLRTPSRADGGGGRAV